MPKEFQQTQWDELVADECRRLARAAVLEDLDRGHDWTTLSLVPMNATGRATIVARQAGVIAGLPAVKIVLEEMDRQLQVQFAAAGDCKLAAQTVNDESQSKDTTCEGRLVPKGTVLGLLEGPARSLLTAERLVLNFLGRLSGIATLAQRFVEAVQGTDARIYDTRKTAPGWRRLEKYAVRQGGACNHRTGLFDAILIKDNHLAIGGTAIGQSHFTPGEAVQRARQFLLDNFSADDPRRTMIVEVEVDSLVQLEHVLPQQPDIVLLDNMSLDDLRRSVALRNQLAKSVELEASGGVSLGTVRSIAKTGVDRISAGALTHSAIVLDVALDWAV